MEASPPDPLETMKVSFLEQLSDIRSSKLGSSSKSITSPSSMSQFTTATSYSSSPSLHLSQCASEESIEHEDSEVSFEQDYTLQHQLGKGHFADVFRCVEKSSGVAYAAKRFAKTRHEKYSCPYRESSIMSSLRHPNILDVEDVLTDELNIWLVLELGPAGTLFDLLIVTKQLGEQYSRIIFKQICSALSYLVSGSVAGLELTD